MNEFFSLWNDKKQISNSALFRNRKSNSSKTRIQLKMQLVEIITLHGKMIEWWCISHYIYANKWWVNNSNWFIFFIFSFFQHYATVKSGIIFFEFTTMIVLLAVAATSMIKRVRAANVLTIGIDWFHPWKYYQP